MRKVNSKGTLHPNNSGNGSSIGMSPSTLKPHSMIKLYNGQTSNPATQTNKINVNIQPSAIIAKTIQSRRTQNNANTNQPSLQNRTNQNITMLIDQEANNNSVQIVKPTQVFSPGDTIQRKNNELTLNNGSATYQKQNPYYFQQQQQNQSHTNDKSSPLMRQKLFASSSQYNQNEYNSSGGAATKTTELYQNMKKQLEKQKSLQTLLNSTQKISAQNSHRSLYQNQLQIPQQQQPNMLNQVALQAKTSRNHITQANTFENKQQRDVIRRGSSKYQQNLTSTGLLHRQNSGFGLGANSNQNSMINSSNLLNNSQRSVASNNQASFGHSSAVNAGFQQRGQQPSALNNSGYQPSSGMFMFKNNLGSLTRNKSAFINLNSNQSTERQNVVAAAYSTNPSISNINKTQIDLLPQSTNNYAQQPVNLIKSKMMIHKESPSVSSDEEKKGESSKTAKPETRLKDFNANISAAQKLTSMKQEVQRVAKQNLVFHQKKRSQLPHGSFIDTKMKNCLHSRNANPSEQSVQAYQTYQVGSKQRALLSKNQSQPNLNQQAGKNHMNLTQRATFVKSSFLKHDESRSVTPINQTQSKSPNPHSHKGDEKASTKSKSSKTKPILGLQGDMKSLNLSPIVPQNLGKHQAQFQREASNSEYQKASNIASASKRLEMRKQSVNSNNQVAISNVSSHHPPPVPQNLNRQFGSLKKERSLVELSKQTSSGPTTEKKNDKSGKMIVDAKKYKPGYSSQETERGPGGTNSYSTADEINLISNESNSGFILRFRNEGGSNSRKMFQNDKSKQYQLQFTDTMNIQDESLQILKKPPVTQAGLFDRTQESKIKINQILNNNNLSHSSNRYNFNITPDQICIPDAFTKNNSTAKATATQANNQTPRAIPAAEVNGIETQVSHQINQAQNITQAKHRRQDIDEEQVTQKKKPLHQNEQLESSFDDDYVDEKDFEEFDRAERSHDSHNSGKVRVQIIEQDSIFRDLQTQPPAARGHAEDLTKEGFYQPSNHILYNYNTAATNLQNQNYFTSIKDDRNSLVNYDTSLLTHNTGRDGNSSPISDVRENRQQKLTVQAKTFAPQQPESYSRNKNKQSNYHSNQDQVKFGQQKNQEKGRQHQQKQAQEYKQQQYNYNEMGGLDIDTNSFLIPDLSAKNVNDETVEFIRPSETNFNGREEHLFEVCKDVEEEQVNQAAVYKKFMLQLQREEEAELEKMTQQIIGSNRYKIIKSDKERAKYLTSQLTSVKSKYKQLLIDRMFAQ